MKRYIKKAIKKITPGITAEIERMRAMDNKLDNKLDVIISELSSSKHDFRLDKLKDLLSQVEHYQSPYNVSGVIDTPKRGSYDRCVAIEDSIGPIAGKRILDIGSSLGYVSFYMADRGGVVQGWEENVKNTEASRLIGDLNGIIVDFKTKKLNDKTVKTIPDSEYDVAVMLSVAHHIIRFNGLDYTKKLIKDLMDKVPVLIVELAKKGEDPSLPWDASQPSDELEIFELVKDDVTINKIGDFSNHLSSKKRPLYVVTKKRLINVNSHVYKYETTHNVAYKDSPVAYSEVQRRYYFGNNFIIKEYFLDKGLSKDTYVQIFNEIRGLTKLADKNIYHLPELLDFEITNQRAAIVLKRTSGKLLSEDKIDDKQMKNVLADVLRTVDGLHTSGYYHNDIRPWNVIVSPDKNSAYLIDFGLSESIQQEDDLAASLQLIIDNAFGSSARNDRLSISEVIKKLPEDWKFLSNLKRKTPIKVADVIERLKEQGPDKDGNK